MYEMRLASLVLCTVACAHEAAPRPEPRPSPPARVEASPPPPMPETAFQSECDACAPPPPTSRFATRSIGEGEGNVAERRWSGRRVNLDLKNADLQEAFRLVADVGKINIVVAGEVSGTVTVKLHDVPWDQALDVIARAKNLAVERDGNVYLVRPAGVPGKP